MTPLSIGVALIAAVIAAVIAFICGKNKATGEYEQKVGSAETRARAIIDDAVKTAETKKREALLEAKEEALKNKNEFEKEQRERRRELQQQEQRILKKEENADRLQSELNRKEKELNQRDSSLSKRAEEIRALHEQKVTELEYTTKLGTRTYEVFYVGQIEETDFSRLGRSSENMITLITCVRNVPEMRWCVQAREIT